MSIDIQLLVKLHFAIKITNNIADSAKTYIRFKTN